MMTKKKTTKFFIQLIILAFVFSLLSCQQKVYYSEKIKFPNQKWNYDSLAHFVVPIDDSTAKYKIHFLISHSEKYPYANLWLKVIVKCPCGAVLIDTVNIWFQDNEQKWIGIGYGKNWIVDFVYQDSAKFNSTGNYDFFFQHIMRKNTVPYLNYLELKIEKLQQYGKR